VSVDEVKTAAQYSETVGGDQDVYLLRSKYTA